MTVIIPVLAAMYLGGSFNLFQYQRGAADIYNTESLKDNILSINRSLTKSQYKLIESSNDARDFLDVDGELSLRIKSGQVDVDGSGSYLKDSSSRDNFVELLVRVQHETVTETIPSSISPNTDWMEKSPKLVGTHYVRSVTYGGELIASVRLKALDKQEREKIKAAVTANLQFTGTLDLGAKGNFDKLRKDLKGSYREEIHTTATVTPRSPPQTIEQLMKLVDEYPEDVMKLNNGKGRPLRAELYPLSAFKRDYVNYMKNSALTSLVDDIDAKYDDLRIAHGEFLSWNARLPYDLSEEKATMVEEFYETLDTALNEFNNAISKIDTTATIEQFREAFKAYGSDGDNSPQKYQRNLWILRNRVTGDSLEWERPNGFGTKYTHWGGEECPNSDNVRLIRGQAVGPLYSSFGGGENVLCMSDDLSELPPLLKKTMTFLRPVGHYDKEDRVLGIKCSECYAPGASSVAVFPGSSSCPEEWRLEYRGATLAEAYSRSGSKFICLDLKTEGEPVANKDSSTKLANIWYDDENWVSCVVCTKF
ncbi:uncharacterized protein [Centruroides vittatus]|uniref:uncharacterized protein n=1 Tax=Centruroides vittatus TaxID=120091 RepID=UPI00350F30BF